MVCERQRERARAIHFFGRAREFPREYDMQCECQRTKRSCQERLKGKGPAYAKIVSHQVLPHGWSIGHMWGDGEKQTWAQPWQTIYHTEKLAFILYIIKCHWRNKIKVLTWSEFSFASISFFVRMKKKFGNTGKKTLKSICIRENKKC